MDKYISKMSVVKLFGQTLIKSNIECMHLKHSKFYYTLSITQSNYGQSYHEFYYTLTYTNDLLDDVCKLGLDKFDKESLQMIGGMRNNE